jgi:hypothetical protein
MQTIKFVHWQDGDAFLGYLLDYPDYWTQGESLDDLKDHLVDLYRDLTSGELPGIRKVDELSGRRCRARSDQRTADIVGIRAKLGGFRPDRGASHGCVAIARRRPAQVGVRMPQAVPKGPSDCES